MIDRESFLSFSQKVNCRIFLEKSFDSQAPKDVARVLQRLLTAPSDQKSAQAWFGLFHEVSCALAEAHTRLEQEVNLNLNSELARSNLHLFEQTVFSQMLDARSQLMDIYIHSPFQTSMHANDNGRITADLKNRRRFLNPHSANLVLNENACIQRYKKFTHTAVTHDAHHKNTPIAFLAGRFQDPNSETRKTAFLSYWEFVRIHENTFQDLFDELLANRIEQARCAGAQNYIELAFAELGRIDYGPETCAIFRDSILKTVVPCLTHLAQHQAQPQAWNDGIWPALAPKIPPAHGLQHNLIPCVGRIVAHLHPQFSVLFQDLCTQKRMDIFPRAHKAPGAYCVALEENGVPFLFGNFSATFKDTLSFIHELGHAFHTYCVSSIPNILLRYPGFEFCEVASIGLELLSSRYFNELWESPSDVLAAQAQQLYQRLHFWPFMAMIDEWQHIIYAQNKVVPRLERNRIWRDLSRKYRPQLNWLGAEPYEELGWLSRPHVFTAPFYFVDYGMAQVAALDLWQMSLLDPQKASEHYLKALSLGAQTSLPALFQTVGSEFAFHSKKLEPLANKIKAQILLFLKK